jgi:hypothetical protein
MELIRRIVTRAIENKNSDFAGDRVELEMDITAVHANGTPLRLAELLETDDFNFNHDGFGIHNRIDRNNGQLTRHFLPRFAVRKDAKAKKRSGGRA